MKKIISTFTAFFVFLSLAGCTSCEKTKEKKDEILGEAVKSYENVKKETRELMEEAKDTKEKLDETVDDFQNAYDELKEAKEALGEITD